MAYEPLVLSLPLYGSECWVVAAENMGLHTDPREGHGNPDFGFYINQIKRAFPSAVQDTRPP